MRTRLYFILVRIDAEVDAVEPKKESDMVRLSGCQLEVRVCWHLQCRLSCCIQSPSHDCLEHGSMIVQRYRHCDIDIDIID